jgi:hypothetical protein
MIGGLKMVPCGSLMYSLGLIPRRSIVVSTFCAAPTLFWLGPGVTVFSLTDPPEIELGVLVESRLGVLEMALEEL